MTVARSASLMGLFALLTHARQHHASDVHLRSGQPPWLRVNGRMQTWSSRDAGDASDTTGTTLITHAQLLAWSEALLAPQDLDKLMQGHALDLAWAWPSLGRFRANLFLSQGTLSWVLRCISDDLPCLATLDVPQATTSLLQGAGLVLVTGPTGSGKSTTLAAMVAHIHAHHGLHVLTLEDPIEFVHASKQSLVTQREVGRDMPDFAAGLRAALREDPDVLMIGELRDLDTIRLALTAAETGHLVLASLHSRQAASAVERIIDVFDSAEKALVRTQLAEALRGVLAQRLVARANGEGRCALYELLIATPAIRHLIREGKTSQIASAMQTGAAQGMVTMAQAQADALRTGRIAAASAG
jgi:twitching motility protein PilT